MTGIEYSDIEKSLLVRLGCELRACRSYCKFTQDAVAEQVGVSAPYIAYIESGKRQVSLLLLTRLCKLYGVNMASLFEDI